jgi:hypothetical protein
MGPKIKRGWKFGQNPANLGFTISIIPNREKEMEHA